MTKKILILFALGFAACKKDPIIPDLDPIAYYTFSGNANDNTKYKNDGYILNSTFTADSFSSANAALKFKESYVEIKNKSIFDLATGKLTLAAWIKPSTTFDSYIIHKASQVLSSGQLSEGVGPFSLDIYPGTARAIIYASDNNSYLLLTGRSYIQSNVWQHLALTWDGKNVCLYYNGKIEATGYFEKTILVTNGNIYIGAYKWAYPIASFDGVIDNVRIYNRSLNSDDIGDLYKNFK